MRTHHRQIAPAGPARRRRRPRGVAETVASSAARSAADERRALGGATFRAHADALFGDAPDGITMQQGGRIVYANRRMAELTGHDDPDGLVGRSPLHFYAEDDLPPVLARLQSTFFGKPTQPARHKLRRVDGSKIPVEAACMLLSLASSPVLVEVVRGLGSR